MAYIEFGPGLPGIRGALAFSPATAKPLCELVEVLLHGPHTLTPAEREMIATYVSAQNDCHYCQSCHGATAAEHLGGRPSDYELVSQVKRNYTVAPVSDKMKALLAIAGEVQKGGKYVTPDDVAAARRQGATDKEIHDTVLIAAAFCMLIDTWTVSQPGSHKIQKSIARLESKRHGWVMWPGTGNNHSGQRPANSSK